MDLARLLSPFLPAPLSNAQTAALATYLDLLLRWNARINLTAVRRPEEMAARHFGESLFAATHLIAPDSRLHVLDFGSGAGFPGLPLKIYAPRLRLTLIESQNKKATFLKEVARALGLADVEVFTGRGETYPGRADLVTLRAVERFASALPVAASLLRSPGASDSAVIANDATVVAESRDQRASSTQQRELFDCRPERSERPAVPASPLIPSDPAAVPRLALLIGAPQVDQARTLLPHLQWDAPIAIPQSAARVLLIGQRVQARTEGADPRR